MQQFAKQRTNLEQNGAACAVTQSDEDLAYLDVMGT